MTDWHPSDDEIEAYFNRLPSSTRRALVAREVIANADDGTMAATVLKAIGLDRATSIIQRHQTDASDGNLPPLSMTGVTAAQCSLFDNWGDKPPVKNAGAHYKATFELWKVAKGVRLSSGKNSHWIASAGLFDSQELSERIRTLAKGRGMSRPWSAHDADDLRGAAFAEYGDTLLEISRNNPAMRIGPVMVAKGRERYPLYTFAVADAAAIEQRKGVEIFLVTGDGRLGFSRFDRALPNGGKFGSANQIMHSRGSNRDEDKGWRTFVLP